MAEARPDRHSHELGTNWYYNNWDFNALLIIFEQETSTKIFEEFDQTIARPTSMKNFNPETDGEYYEGDDSIHKPVNKSHWTYSLIEPVFNKVVSLTGSDQKSYDMFGHSAGSQFAYRFFLFKKDMRVDKVISSNAGWYTMTDFDIGFPYGLKNTAVDEETIKQRFKQHLVIQMGENDNDPNARYLRTTDEAMEQGSTDLKEVTTFLTEPKKFQNQWVLT